MKQLLDTKVQRGVELKEWTPSAQHLTHEGQVAFHARMQERIRAAQQQPKAVVKMSERRAKK